MFYSNKRINIGKLSLVSLAIFALNGCGPGDLQSSASETPEQLGASQQGLSSGPTLSRLSAATAGTKASTYLNNAVDHAFGHWIYQQKLSYAPTQALATIPVSNYIPCTEIHG